MDPRLGPPADPRLGAESSSGAGLLPGTVALLRHWLTSTQVSMRQPSLVGALGRAGALVWCEGAGSVTGRPGGGPPGPDTAYRIASVTKTFVAVAVLRLVEQGRISLQDKVCEHVPDAPCGTATVAQLLSHTSGLQAETDGDWWERSPGYRWEQLVAMGMTARFPAGRTYHYSNVGYAVLGRLLEQLHARPWDEVLARELLEPLGLTRTTCHRPDGAATGWAVHPHAALLHAEPVPAYLAMGPAGELWSTPRDLVTWGSFLAGAIPGPLGAELLAEMRAPWAVLDLPGQPWVGGHGLGLQVWNDAGRRYAGHTGSVPGYTGELRLDPGTADVVVTLGSATTGFGGGAGLLALLAQHEPAIPVAWEADSSQVRLLELVGGWYWGTAAYLMSAAPEGALELSLASSPARSGTFHPVGVDRWVGRGGYFDGEPLVVGRDEAGRACWLDLASFRLSRTPYAPQAPIPGGLDPAGWH